MCQFDDVANVEAELERLSEGPSLTRRLPRRPGHKEDRWVETLTNVALPTEASDLSMSAEPATDDVDAPTLSGVLDELSLLRNEVRALRAELDTLRIQLGG
jgi:uncharacterized protein YceH (UPF0502 family)